MTKTVIDRQIFNDITSIIWYFGICNMLQRMIRYFLALRVLNVESLVLTTWFIIKQSQGSEKKHTSY